MRAIERMPDCRSERIKIDGDVVLYAREMSAADVIGMHESPSNSRQQELVAKSVVDDSGEPAFTAAELDRLPARIWRDLVQAVNSVNGLVEDGEPGEV